MKRLIFIVAFTSLLTGCTSDTDFDYDFYHHNADPNLPGHRDPRFHNNDGNFRHDDDHHNTAHGYTEDGNHVAEPLRPRQERPHLQTRIERHHRYVERD